MKPQRNDGLRLPYSFFLFAPHTHTHPHERNAMNVKTIGFDICRSEKCVPKKRVKSFSFYIGTCLVFNVQHKPRRNTHALVIMSIS